MCTFFKGNKRITCSLSYTRTEGADKDFFKGEGDGIFYHYEIHRKLVPSEICVIGRGAKGLRGV
jgi:hypothetical protein